MCGDKKLIKRWLAGLVAVCMFLPLLPVHAWAADDAADSWDALAAAIEQADAGTAAAPTEIDIAGELTADKNIKIEGKHIRLVPKSDHAKVTRGNGLIAQALFQVTGADASLTIDTYTVGSDTHEIVLDGGWGDDSDGIEANQPLILVYDGAALTMNGGALQNNYSYGSDPSTRLDEMHGGGVYVGPSDPDASENDSSSFTMHGGVLRNLRAVIAGGGVSVCNGASFLMDGGTFENCRVKQRYGSAAGGGNAWGGGIYASGGKVEIRGQADDPIVFTQCSAGDENDTSADDHGGAIAAVSGGSDTPRGTLSVEHARFDGANVLDSPVKGGAVYTKSQQTVSLQNVAFSGYDSEQNDEGGALHVTKTQSPAQIDHAVFKQCSAALGGAAWLDHAVVSNTSFSDCHAVKSEYYSHYGKGGAVFAGTDVLFDAVTIDGCSAFYTGGAVQVNEEAREISFQNVKITNCTASGGEVATGGGIYISRGTDVLLNGIQVQNCHADYYGGGILAEKGTLKLKGKIVVSQNTMSKGTSNFRLNDDALRLTLAGPLADGSNIGMSFWPEYQIGATIMAPASGVAGLQDTDITKFFCDNSLKYVLEVQNGKLILQNNEEPKTHWEKLAAQIANAPTGTPDAPTEITVAGDFETTNKETIAVNGKHIRLVAENGAASITRGASYTAAFFDVQNGGSLTLGDAPAETGGITLNGGGRADCSSLIVVTKGAFTLNAGTLTNNQTGTQGSGAVQMTANAGSKMYMNGGVISNCSSTGNGGAMYIQKSNEFYLNGGLIKDCRAVGRYGGAIMANPGKIVMDGGVIEGCSANYGGGICVYNAASSLKILSGAIENCQATSQGGGLYLVSADVLFSAGTIKACTGSNAGGIYAYQNNVTVSGGQIISCSAENSGGGAYVTGGAKWNMKSGSVRSCTAKNGGGIYCTASTISMSDGTISDCNTTGGRGMGGGILLEKNGTIELSGGTIERCEGAYGGGITAWPGVVTITGGQIKGCTSTYKGGGGVYVAYDSTASEFAMSGGSITECSGASNVGGIYFNRTVPKFSGDARVENNTVGSEKAPGDLMLAEGQVLEIAGPLTENAHIGVSHESPAVGTVIAKAGGGYSVGLTEADAARLHYGGDGYNIVRNNQKQAVLSSTVSIEIDITGNGRTDPAGPLSLAAGTETTISLLPDHGYRLTGLQYNGADVLAEAKRVTGSYREHTYTFIPAADGKLCVTFGVLTGEYMETAILPALPDVSDGVSAAEEQTIWDVKLDYEKLAQAEMDKLAADTVAPLHRAVLALDQVQATLVAQGGLESGALSASELTGLLAEMSYDEALALKKGERSSYEIRVAVSPKTDATQQEREALAAAADGAVLGRLLDISVIKIIDGAQTAVHSLRYPLKLTFAIPEDMKREGRTFSVIRLHDGTAEKLAVQETLPLAVTVESSLFSTYALAYRDKPAYTVRINAQGKGVAAPSGAVAVEPGQAVTIQLTPNYGYKLNGLRYNGVDVLPDTQTVAGSYRAHTYTIIPTGDGVIEASFAGLTGDDMSSGVVPALPDSPEDVTEQDTWTILDAKLDYELMDPEEKDKVATDAVKQLNQAVAALERVKVEMVYENELHESDLAAQNLLDLIGEMTYEEALKLKQNQIQSYAIRVKAEEKEVLAADQSVALAAAVGQDTLGAAYEVTVSKIVDHVETPMNSLRQPLKLVFAIPEELRRSGRAFYMIRLHDGQADRLLDEDNDPSTVTVTSGLFSIYALAYEEQNTGGSSTHWWTLSASAGAGGRITPAGKLSVLQGSDKAFSIVPDEGCRIADVRVDGESVGAVSDYMFRSVRKSHTIEALFEKTEADWPFTDVRESDWFYPDVEKVYRAGVMRGTGGTLFSPEQPIDRAMAAAVIYRMAGSPAGPVDSGFSDVRPGAYYTSAVAWCEGQGLIKGYGNGQYGPADLVTREQFAAILFRYAQKNADTADLAQGELTAFSDQAAVSPWARQAVRWAVGAGLLRGNANGTLEPIGAVTRAQAAAMLARFMEMI